MKTFKFIGMALFAVLMCVNIASCGSSDDDPIVETEEGGVVVSGKKITKIVSESEGWKETRTFAYDDKGRLIKSTETDEHHNEKSTRTYQFTWGDDAVKCSGDNNYTFTLKNGLVQRDEWHTYSYNASNRLVKVETSYSSTTAIWDGDKLMSISNDDEDNTFTYGQTCNKGFFPFAANMIDDCELFVVHPEIAGSRTTQLPASKTEIYGYNQKTITFSYEFDKEGYIAKIICKGSDGSTETVSIIWQ